MQPREPEWAGWPDDKLLEMRVCDLGVTIRGTMLERRIRDLRRELRRRGLTGFRPHFWLSDEWYCPDGVPGVAIPFYLAHPRLIRLERKLMLDAEGSNRDEFMRLMRHETGHAIDNAYRIRRRRSRQKLFGYSSERYLDDYLPRPYSRRYVVHLDGWYAQSHPDEDFAETFAVWLTPGSSWRTRYAGWPAIKKLRYVDEVMREVAGRPQPVTTRTRMDAVSQLRKTLREHYDQRRAYYSLETPVEYDRDLRRLFSNDGEFNSNPSASRFIGRIRKNVRRRVAKWTGVFQYTIDQVIAEMIDRCRELELRLAVPPEEAELDFTIALTVHTLNYVNSGRPRVVR